ncbi:MAG: hypothetical protein V3R73_02170, partial [Sphingomonadales bacterium]
YPEAEIDIGEIAAQYLSMAINPFPRKAGAELSAKPPEGVQILTEEEAVAAASPFANLKELNEKVDTLDYKAIFKPLSKSEANGKRL